MLARAFMEIAGCYKTVCVLVIEINQLMALNGISCSANPITRIINYENREDLE